MNKHEINIDKNLCIGCNLCVDICPANNIEMKSKKADLVSQDCLMCGQCTAICPKKAVSMTGYEDEQIEKTGEVQLDPDEVLDVIRFRRSIRHFKDESIPEEVVEQILEAGRLTHTAQNKQDVSYIVLDKEKDRMEKIAVNLFKKIKPLANLVSPMSRRSEITDDFFFFQAPIVIVVLAKDEVNGLLAAQNMEFVAEAHGLGVLFSGFFAKAANTSFKLKRELQIPKGKKVATALVLGYPKRKFLRSTHHEKLDVKYL